MSGRLVSARRAVSLSVLAFALPLRAAAAEESPPTLHLMVVETVFEGEPLNALCLRRAEKTLCYGSWPGSSTGSPAEEEGPGPRLTSSFETWLEEATSGGANAEVEAEAFSPSVRVIEDVRRVLGRRPAASRAADQATATATAEDRELIRARLQALLEQPPGSTGQVLKLALLTKSRQIAPPEISASRSPGQLVALGLISALLLPLISIVGLRMAAGCLPSPRLLRDHVRGLAALGQAVERLTAWAQENGERASQKPMPERLLELIDRVHERSEALRQDLGPLLGEQGGLASLHSSFRGQLAPATQGQPPRTLREIVEELCELRRLRCAIEERLGAASAPPLSLERLTEEVTVALGPRKRVEQVLAAWPSLRLPELAEELAGFLPSADAALLEAGNGSDVAQVRSFLLGCGKRLSDLVQQAGVEQGGAADRQIDLINDRWKVRETEAADLRRSSDTVAGEQRETSNMLDRWSAASTVVGKAREIAGHLARLTTPERDASGAPWHHGLEERLKRLDGIEEERLRELETVAGYLGLAGADRTGEVLARERDKPHRELRLALLAELGGAQELRRSSGENARLFEALRLETVLEGLGHLLGELWKLPDRDALWIQGFEPGFSAGWLHSLFRAQLVLETYYREDEPGRRFRPVRALAEACERALAAVEHPVVPLRLLEPLESTAERVFLRSSLITLPTVGRKVAARQQRGGQGFVVDVECFAVEGYEHLPRSRVLLFSPADWPNCNQELL